MDKSTFIAQFEGVEIPEEKLNSAYAAHEASLLDAHSAVTNTTLSGVDAKIETETGVKKNQGEKSADYYIRAFSTFRESAVSEYKGTVDQLKADLEKAKKRQGSTPEEIKLLQDQLIAKTEEIEGLKGEYATKETEREFNAKVEKILSGFAINPTYDKEVADIYMNKVRESAKSVKTIMSGDQELVLDKDELTPLLKDGKPVTFANYLTGQLSKIASPNDPHGGGLKTNINQQTGSAIVGNPKTKLEAYSLVENQYSGNPKEREKRLSELMADANYKALPKY